MRLRLLGLLAVCGLVACHTTWLGWWLPETGATEIPNITVVTAEPQVLEITELELVELGDHVYGVNACTTGFGGVGITLKVSVKSEAGTEWQVLKELGVPCFNDIDRPTWDTNGLPNGGYLLRVQARGPNDADWEDAAELIRRFVLE